jgi:hypothetical protein
VKREQELGLKRLAKEPAKPAAKEDKPAKKAKKKE